MQGFVLNAAIETFQGQKRLAERAMEQMSDEQLHFSPGAELNCVAVIVKHMAGNMRSRWTDFLSTDGEKPWRNRDNEFVDTFRTRGELFEAWEAGWTCLFDALNLLSDDDLERMILIRGERCTVVRAINRQIDHYGYHVGQIVTTARLLVGTHWNTLSIPRGGPEEYNKRVWKTDEQ